MIVDERTRQLNELAERLLAELGRPLDTCTHTDVSLVRAALGDAFAFGVDYARQEASDG